ncbi:ATP-binding protein [Streptomyces sp. NPDC127084]|uniref:ATP-binding protein n=1 Tax=Streptomyces sp. NPDC127084 TaxID=3347133 RepID=UPI0036607173
MSTDEITAAGVGTADWSRPESAAEARDTVRRLLHGGSACGRPHEAPGAGGSDGGAGSSAESARSKEPAGAIEEARLADALLVTSELVTNAIRHGGGVASFAARVTREGLRLQVTDRSRVRPATVARADDTFGAHPGGHGWRLVQRLCRDITITPLAGGKTIQVLVGLI